MFSREDVLDLARRVDSLPRFIAEFDAEERMLVNRLSAQSAKILAEARDPDQFWTTVIAFQTTEENGQGGLIIGADSLASTGSEVSQGRFKKLFEIDPLSSLGISGLAVSGQRIARHLEIKFQRFSRRYHHPHAKSKANLVARAIGQIGGCAPLFVTWDPEEERGRIFKYDFVGSIVEMEEGYASVGSGSRYIQSEMLAMAPKIRKKPAVEAVADVVYLLSQAAHCDPGHTGGDFFIHLVLPPHLLYKKDGDEIIPIKKEIVVPEDDWKTNGIISRKGPAAMLERILRLIVRSATPKTSQPPSPPPEKPSQPDNSPPGQPPEGGGTS